MTEDDPKFVAAIVIFSVIIACSLLILAHLIGYTIVQYSFSWFIMEFICAGGSVTIALKIVPFKDKNDTDDID